MTESLVTHPAEDTTPAPDRRKLLQVHFGGLCSFVKVEEGYRVLLVAAERSSVRPRLCSHSSVLLFRAEDLAGLEGGTFYRSFLNADGKVLCAWDLAGCDLEILPESYQGPDNPFDLSAISADDSFEQVLDLRSYGNGVARDWLAGELHPDGLVSARFRLPHGQLSSGLVSRESWEMVLPGRKPSGRGQSLGQTVVYELRAGEKAEKAQVVELRADNYLSGGRRSLRLTRGADIAVSSFCAFSTRTVFEERDVLAYYELCRVPPALADRPRPVFVGKGHDDVLPGESACPPARQADGTT